MHDSSIHLGERKITKIISKPSLHIFHYLKCQLRFQFGLLELRIIIVITFYWLIESYGTYFSEAEM